MIDVAKYKMFGNFTVLNKALLFLIKLNRTAMQSVLCLMSLQQILVI